MELDRTDLQCILQLGAAKNKTISSGQILQVLRGIEIKMWFSFVPTGTESAIFGRCTNAQIISTYRMQFYKPKNGTSGAVPTRKTKLLFDTDICPKPNNILRNNIWHSKVCFWVIKNGHFWQKCPFSIAKKWHFQRPNLRTDSKNLAKHPPKWLGRHLVHAFRFLGGF